MTAAQFESAPAAPSRVIVADHWLLEMVVAGDLAIRVDGGRWRRRTVGTGVLYAPGAQYQERRVDSRRPRQYTSLYVAFADDSGQLAPMLLMTGRFCWIADSDQQLQRMLHDVIGGLDGGPAAAMSATGSLYQIIGLLLAAEPRGDGIVLAAQGGVIPDMIATLHRYMRANLAEPIRLADLADCVSLSQSALSHSYRRITGRTPMVALRAMRIEAARLHLIRGHLTLAAIGELTGFADAFHLSRTFKRVTGQSPRQFRQAALAH